MSEETRPLDFKELVGELGEFVRASVALEIREGKFGQLERTAADH